MYTACMDSLTANEVKAIREAAGMTVAEAAKVIGITARAWQYWESGNRTPSPQTSELIRIKIVPKSKPKKKK